MPFRFNPFTDKLDLVDTSTGPVGDILTITGNSGGAVPGDGAGNINLIGATGENTLVAGNAGTNTLSISILPLSPLTVKQVQTPAASYAVLSDDVYIGLTGAVPQTVVLPVPTDGRYLIIKDEIGNAGTQTKTLDAATNGSTIDGQATYVFSRDFESAVLTYGGSGWEIIGAFGDGSFALEGDSGGVILPDSSNVINVLGNPDIEIAGDAGTHTLQLTNLTAWSKYVVDPTVGNSRFTTIQSAMDQANTDGGGTVVIHPGTYTENLVCYDGVDLYAACAVSQNEGATVSIIGTHTPPLSGHIGFNSIYFQSSGDTFASNDAGTCHLGFFNCESAVQSGYFLNVPNWTGILEIYDCNPGSSGAPFVINDGGVNNTAGAPVIAFNAGIGYNSTTEMHMSGDVFVQSLAFGAPVTFSGNATLNLQWVEFAGTITLSDASSGIIEFCSIISGADQAITMTSSGDVQVLNCTISSSNAAPIGGASAASLLVANTTITNGTQSQEKNQIPSSSTQDVSTQWSIGLSQSYAIGIDNSDSDALKITSDTSGTAAPSIGTTLVDITSGGAISFPAAGFTTDGVLYSDTGGLLASTAVGTAGDVLTSNGAGMAPTFQTPAASMWTLATPQATTSGTAFNFPGIPSGTKVIHINFTEVSLSGTDDITCQIGPSGGVEATGYVGDTTNITASTQWNTYAAMTPAGAATMKYNGSAILSLLDSSTNTWSFNINFGSSTGLVMAYGGGSKALAGTLSQLTISRSGTNTFDSGAINIMYS